MMSIKVFRIYNMRCIKVTLLWTVCLLVVYLFSEDFKPQHRKMLRLSRPDSRRRTAFLTTGEETIDSLTWSPDDSDGDEKGYQNNEFDNEKETKYTKQSVTFNEDYYDEESFWRQKRRDELKVNREKNNDNNRIDIENIEDDQRNDKEDTESKKKYSLTNVEDDFTDEGRDNPGDKKPQSVMLISALREQVANPLALKSGRLPWTIAWAGSYSPSLYSPPPNEMPKQRLPQAIIIGFGKCGTRALIDFLSMHPYVVTAGPEIHFFDVDENFAKGWDWYRDQMPLSYSNQITIEKTPSYIWSERAKEEIYKMNKQVKLIVIMKDPVTRIVSQALRSGLDVESMSMVMRDGHLQVNNESRTVQWGMYAIYLQSWMKKFSKSQIHVLESSEFAKQPATELQKIETFLGIPHRITENNFYFNKTKGFHCKRPFHIQEIECLSDGKGRQHPLLHPLVEKKLYEFFRGYNEILFRLIGRRFKWEPQNLVKVAEERKTIK